MAETELPRNLGPLVLTTLDHALAAGEREALKVGVPAHNVIEMLLNHLASVVAMIEPAGARYEVIKGLVESFSTMVAKHVDRRYTTAGGVKLPRSLP
jgi:hypothetical protein